MQLEHPPRITGLPSTTETKSVWNILSQIQISNRATSTVHFICSSSIYYFIDIIYENERYSRQNHHTVFELLGAIPTELFVTHNESSFYKKHQVPICNTAFNVFEPDYADRHILQRIYRSNIYTLYSTVWLPDGRSLKLYARVHHNGIRTVQYELFHKRFYATASVVDECTKSYSSMDLPENTACYDSTDDIRKSASFRFWHLPNTRTICFEFLARTTIENYHHEQVAVCTNYQTFNTRKMSRSWRKRRSKHRIVQLHDSTIITKKPENSKLGENEIDVEKKIRKTSRVHVRKYEKGKIHEFGRRKFNQRNYGLLLVLYLLALPLLGSTYPSGGIIASVSFVKKSSLVHTDNITARHLSPVARLRSSGSRIHPQFHKEHSQNREQNHPYNEYMWEVNQINPWLSACDLAGPAPADLQGSCGPPEVPKYCPKSCSLNSNADRIFHEVVERLIIPKKWRTGSAAKIQWKTVKGNTAPDQCLFYLEESHKRDICREDFAQSSSLSFSSSRENRYWFLSGLRSRHCCEHAVLNALAPGDGGPLEDVLNGTPRCINALEKILSVDALAARLHCEFEEVLARYDCRQSYSVIHNCTHCKEAYRKWVCSSLVPYFVHEGPSISLKSVEVYVGTRLRPCRSFCQSVEQRCPYLLPGDRAPAYPTQYAGEPTFLCRDPNIPETGEQATRALHADEDKECCFRVCSEDEPGSGICTSCAEDEPNGRQFSRDPPSAPHCEMMNFVESDFADLQNNAGNIVGLSLPASPSTTSASSSICVSSGSGSLSSSSSSSNVLLLPGPVSLLCFLWIWVALISLCQVVFPWSPALDAGFVCKRSSHVAKRTSSTINKLKVKDHNSSFLVVADCRRIVKQLPHLMFYYFVSSSVLHYHGYWYVVGSLGIAYRCTIMAWFKIFKLSYIHKPRNFTEHEVDHCGKYERFFPSYEWRCYRYSASTRKKARIRGGRLKRRLRKRLRFIVCQYK